MAVKFRSRENTNREFGKIFKILGKLILMFLITIKVKVKKSRREFKVSIIMYGQNFCEIPRGRSRR